jgi:hypothetical protein
MANVENIHGVTLSQVDREGGESAENVIWEGSLQKLESTNTGNVLAADKKDDTADKVKAAFDIGKMVLDFLKDNTGYDAAASSTYLLHHNDTSGLDYRPSESWRCPASKWRDWKVAFWGTAGAMPLAGFQFFFNVTNHATPSPEATALGVPMGYYIPNITCTPHAIVAAPGYWMSAAIHFSNPTATIIKIENKDFLLPKVQFSLSVACNRFGIFKSTKVWTFELAGDSSEVVSTL